MTVTPLGFFIIAIGIFLGIIMIDTPLSDKVKGIFKPLPHPNTISRDLALALFPALALVAVIIAYFLFN